MPSQDHIPVRSVKFYLILGFILIHLLQVESAELIWNLLENSTFAVTKEEEVSHSQDAGVLRQDRYPLRTAPQFLGPQIEDLLHSLESLTIECNSSAFPFVMRAQLGKLMVLRSNR